MTCTQWAQISLLYTSANSSKLTHKLSWERDLGEFYRYRMEQNLVGSSKVLECYFGHRKLPQGIIPVVHDYSCVAKFTPTASQFAFEGCRAHSTTSASSGQGVQKLWIQVYNTFKTVLKELVWNPWEALRNRSTSDPTTNERKLATFSYGLACS